MPLKRNWIPEQSNMRKAIFIIGMVIAIIEIAYSFVSNSETGQFFGVEYLDFPFDLGCLIWCGV